MPDSDIPPPFIGTQRLFWLTAPWSKRREWIVHRFRSLRRLDESGKKLVRTEQDNSLNEESEYGWDEQVSREEFLIRKDIRYLCVTEDAGMGKSKCLEQIEYLRMADDPGHLCIRVEFADLPGSPRKYLAGKWLAQCVADQLQATQQDSKECMNAVQRLVAGKAATVRLTLLVDALDQSNRERGFNAVRAARALAGFLRKHPNVRCVVSGRPFSIQFYWRHLLAKTDHPWEFVQVDEFTKVERDSFLGPARAEKVGSVEADVLSVPRSLETIRGIDADKLTGVRTASEIYWLCTEQMLQRAKLDQTVSISHLRAKMLLSLVAFEQIRRGLYAGTDGRTGIRGESALEKFVQTIFNTYAKWLKKNCGYRSAEELHAELGQLNALNVGLDPGVLAVPMGTDPHSPTCTQLVFRNRTLQDFFAALWVTRYCAEAKVLKWLQRHVYVRASWGEHFREGSRYEFWKLASDMPGGARDDATYAHAMSSLYLPYDPDSSTDQSLIGSRLTRSTEMIYRSWWQLMGIAGWLPQESAYSANGSIVERDVLDATLERQTMVRAKFDRGELALESTAKLPKKARRAAQHVVQQYLVEFLTIASGRSGTTAQQKVAREFDCDGFVPIEAGRYWFGESAKERVLKIGFLLAKFPCTNELLFLFDPKHADTKRFGEYTKYSLEPTCPAIFVDWFTAWAAAIWLHGYLPDEFQWERACRGKNIPPLAAKTFSTGDLGKDLDRVAWYYSNSNYKTHPVGGESETKLPNDFGLYHMHGSVREWTSSWSHHDPEKSSSAEFKGDSRVLRGGAFLVIAVNCRSACRDSGHPTYSIDIFGFRVSRARKS